MEGDLPQMLTKDPVRSFESVSGIPMLQSRFMPYQQQSDSSRIGLRAAEYQSQRSDYGCKVCYHADCTDH